MKACGAGRGERGEAAGQFSENRALRGERSALVTVLLLLRLQTRVPADDTKPPDINPELGAADRLYRAGKFAEAENSYQAVLKNDSKLMPVKWCLPKLALRGQCYGNRRLMKH